ncbi:hypothetical protein [Pseudomonas sp. RIT-PI-AD]|nr:hypothetical protein [Pseudomonas sp. RIT-PI-AD]
MRDCLADSIVRRALNDRHLSNDDLLMTLIDDVVREVDKKRH